MKGSVNNLRIHLYGTQGSFSTYPSVAESEAFQAQRDSDLLTGVFENLERLRDEHGRLSQTVEEILGEPMSRESLLRYRDRLTLEQPLVYGGWTTCVLVETADGHDIVLDCGSGFRNCAQDLQRKWAARDDRKLTILGTHSHIDHTVGFDQAEVCFDSRNTLQIYGNSGFLEALDGYLGIFSRTVRDEIRGLHTPISYDKMAARFVGVEVRGEGSAHRSPSPRAFLEVHDLSQPICIGDTVITPFEVHHTVPCLGYTIERNGRRFVFCTDHELRRGGNANTPLQRRSEEAEARVVEQAQDADVLYRDAQYLREEYDGLKGIGLSRPMSRRDWGHSCFEDVLEMVSRCNVKRAYLGHLDPSRDWSERSALDRRLRDSCSGRAGHVELARAGTVIEI